MIWRQQKYNNSCVLCALSTLMSAHHIDLNVDKLALMCYIPFMIEYNQQDSSFNCGFLAWQNPLNYQNALNPYYLKFNEIKSDNLEYFLDKINELLDSHKTMLVSLAASELPYNKINLSGSGGHVVVLLKKEADHYLCMDSDAGLNRSIDYKFETVEDTVVYSLTEQDLRSALKTKNPDSFVLAYLSEVNDLQIALSYEQIIKTSLQALSELNNLLNIETLSFTDYDQFYQFTLNVIRPFVIDFYTGLTIIDPNMHNLKLINLLKDTLLDLKYETFSLMKQFKDNSVDKDKLTAYYLEKLRIISSLIYEFLVK